MHQGRPDQDTARTPSEHDAPATLSHSDPSPDSSTGPPIWLIIIGVLVLAAFVLLHATGVLGPGMH